MKHLKQTNIVAWLLLSILGGLVLHAPLSVWLVSHGAPESVKAWKEIALALATVLMLFDQPRRVVAQIKSDHLLQLILVYAALHMVAALFSQTTSHSMMAGLLIDLRYVWYFAVVYIFLRMYPTFCDWFVRVGVAGAVLVLGFAMLQVLLPSDVLKHVGYSSATIKPYILLDENPDYVRINSTMRGPNPLGAYAMIALLGVVAYGMAVGRLLHDARKKMLHACLAIGGMAALWVSYSRSAVLGFVVGLTMIFVSRFRGGVSRRQIVAACAAMLVLGGFVYSIRDTSFFHNVILHDNPTTGAEVTSDQGHASSLAEGIHRMLVQPFGAGIGSTGSASLVGNSPLIIENQYLMVAHEVGWLGLGLFVALWGIVLWRLWRQRTSWLGLAMCASGIGLAAISLTWPVLSDDPVSMIWWGMAAVALITETKSKGTKHGTTTHKKAA